MRNEHEVWLGVLRVRAQHEKQSESRKEEVFRGVLWWRVFPAGSIPSAINVSRAFGMGRNPNDLLPARHTSRLLRKWNAAEERFQLATRWRTLVFPLGPALGKRVKQNKFSFLSLAFLSIWDLRSRTQRAAMKGKKPRSETFRRQTLDGRWCVLLT